MGEQGGTVVRGAVAARGIVTRYEMAGTGRPVVLVHGLGCSKAIWSRLRDRLCDRYKVVAYDLRGSGDTRPHGSSDAFSLDGWADDLAALLAELGIERPALVGHSLGASVILKYAIKWPDAVFALVLVGSDPNLSRLAPRMERMAEIMGELGLERWVEEHWSANPPFSAESLERDPEILAEYRAMVLANHVSDYQRTCRAIASSEDLEPLLPGLDVPTLVLGGGLDDRTKPEAGRALAAMLPNASYTEVPGAGHTLPLEAPELVGQAIEEFLAGLATEPAASAGSKGGEL